MGEALPEDRNHARTVKSPRTLDCIGGSDAPPIAHMGIYLDRPAQDVFDYVMDIGRTPEWRPRMSGAEWITPGPPGVGSKMPRPLDTRSSPS